MTWRRGLVHMPPHCSIGPERLSLSSCDYMARGFYSIEARIMASHKKQDERDVVSATYRHCT
jgi:hypothetical protein